MNVITQPDLLGGEHTLTATGRPLTARQQTVWELVQQTDGGITAEEAGAVLHAAKGRHAADQFCSFCYRDGAQVMRSKAVAPLVVRRRISGRWEPRERTPVARELEPLVEPTEAQLAVNPFWGLDT